MDEIVVRVIPEGHRNVRQFTLGPAVNGWYADNLSIALPTTSASEWGDQLGKLITIQFYKRNMESAAGLPGAVQDPTVTDDSLGWLLNQSYDGPVTTQLMVTLITFLLVLWKFPKKDGRKPYVLLAVLVFTPWAPAAVGYGSNVLAVIMMGVSALAWMGWRVLSRPAR